MPQRHTLLVAGNLPIARGFTLVELVVMLAVIGIIAALAVPRYAESMNHYRVSTAARKVAADLTYAQTRARAVSTTRTISFGISGSTSGTAANTYQILSEIDPITASTYTVNLAGAPYSSSILSATFNGSATVSFNGFGIPTSAGTITLQSGDATSTITLDGVSGMVNIQ